MIVTQLCLTLCHSMNCSPSGFSVHGIFQARILEWVPFLFSRGPSWPRDRNWVSCIAGRFFNISAILEAMGSFSFQPPLCLPLTLQEARGETDSLVPFSSSRESSSHLTGGPLRALHAYCTRLADGQGGILWSPCLLDSKSTASFRARSRSY